MHWHHSQKDLGGAQQHLMTLMAVGQRGLGGGGSRSKVLGEYNDGWDSYVTAIGGCKKWHIGEGIGCCNVGGIWVMYCIEYRGGGLGRWHLIGGEWPSRGVGCRWGGRRESSASSPPCWLRWHSGNRRREASTSSTPCRLGCRIRGRRREASTSSPPC